MNNRKAIFWDRDGIINKIEVKDGKSLSPRKFEDFKIYPFIEGIFQECRNKDYLNIIFTNQPDISRNLMDPKELELMHAFLKKKLPITDIYVCPHSDNDKCFCRKPLPGMIKLALKKHDLTPKNCIVVGDRITDVIAGFSAGIEKLFLLQKSYSYNKYSRDNLPTYKIILDLNQFIDSI